MQYKKTRAYLETDFGSLLILNVIFGQFLEVFVNFLHDFDQKNN